MKCCMQQCTASNVYANAGSYKNKKFIQMSKIQSKQMDKKNVYFFFKFTLAIASLFTVFFLTQWTTSSFFNDTL